MLRIVDCLKLHAGLFPESTSLTQKQRTWLNEEETRKLIHANLPPTDR